MSLNNNYINYYLNYFRMEAPKFKFKSTAKKNTKETEKKKERDNFSIEESKKFYKQWLRSYIN